MSQYQLRTEVFEGPLELLLSLIEKRKLLINDIALANVADDYLKYLEQHPEFPISETAQFVLVGSTLLLIKSKSLLPVLTFTSEEQESVEDLEVRLKVLDRYKTAARVLEANYATHRIFTRRQKKHIRVEFSPDASMGTDKLLEAVRAVLAHLPRRVAPLPEKTVQKVVSIEEMMDRLTQRINDAVEISFRDAANYGAEHRVNVIVTFLAMLELVRQGVIRVEQEAAHGDIQIHKDSVGLPSYA